jgi:hypothetical protein
MDLSSGQDEIVREATIPVPVPDGNSFVFSDHELGTENAVTSRRGRDSGKPLNNAQ